MSIIKMNPGQIVVMPEGGLSQLRSDGTFQRVVERSAGKVTIDQLVKKHPQGTAQAFELIGKQFEIIQLRDREQEGVLKNGARYVIDKCDYGTIAPIRARHLEKDQTNWFGRNTLIRLFSYQPAFNGKELFNRFGSDIKGKRLRLLTPEAPYGYELNKIYTVVRSERTGYSGSVAFKLGHDEYPEGLWVPGEFVYELIED